VPCPYLEDREFVQEYFFGAGADADETASLLEAGWRHFGSFFFRPRCVGCQACEPLRVDVRNLTPTASQRRVWNKNSDVEFKSVPSIYQPEYYAVYEEHSRLRFGKDSDEQDFQSTFFERAVPGFLTEYRVKGQLAALGFCDLSAVGLSSVYFVFRDEFADRSLGIFSVLKECELARQQGLAWYFLGFHVRGNATMAYKGRFHPRQILDWNTGKWETSENSSKE